MSNTDKIAAIDKYLEILTHARQRPEMYFQPVDAVAVLHYLDGLRTGISVWGGVFWSPDHREPALHRRGLELTAMSEVPFFEQRGLSPIEIVDELLAIEFETWQAHRDALTQLP